MSGDHLLRGKARDREQHDGWAAGQRTLGAAAKESRQYPEKRGKLPRPTWKELHLHFQVTEVRRIKPALRVMAMEKHVTEAVTCSGAAAAFCRRPPSQTPRLGATHIRLELRREGIRSVSLLLSQKRNQI